MGVLTPKRAVLCIVAVLLGTSAFANHPSPRTLARMVDLGQGKGALLFGGRGVSDAATTAVHVSDETWIWTGSTWLQQFPETKPPERSSQSMVFDSVHDRVIMFGGRQEPANTTSELPPIFLADTWAWHDGNWTAVESAEHPSPRHYSGIAYDSSRDRVVLYGGAAYEEDGITPIHFSDTWELEGSQWTRVIADTPKVIKPLLEYDATAKKVVLIGTSDTGTIVMYTYDGDAHAWNPVTLTADKLPTCVDEGHLVYQEHRGRLLFFGGLCTSGTPQGEESWEYDGSGWVKQIAGNVSRGFGQAVAYDPLRDQIVSYGGNNVISAAVSAATFVLRDGIWFGAGTSRRPLPRSLATFVTDPVSNTIWMFGGLEENSSYFYVDQWGFRGGQWYYIPTSDSSPVACDSPLAVFDTNRSRLVLTCSSTEIYEYDGTAWKGFSNLDEIPDSRRFAAMVYDDNLKKTVLFGGFTNNNYRNDTWTWDGTKWEELDIRQDDRPHHRGLMTMWYDPLQKKTILYGGIGRGNVNQKVTRFGDMWAFNGTTWSELTVPETPGPRLGPQIAVQPLTGKVLLFGGLRVEQLDDDAIRQFFDNDTWEWDGAASRWTRLAPARSPDARENGALAWDPAAAELVLFGGYAKGFYLSDLWVWNGETWIPRPDSGGRRRTVR